VGEKKAEEIRTLWRKYKGLSSVLAEWMQRAIRACLYDRMNMLEEEFPEQAKELNDEVKERRKNKSETRKERKENVDRTHSTLANRRASVEEGKEESKKGQEDFEVQTRMPGRLLSKHNFQVNQAQS